MNEIKYYTCIFLFFQLSIPFAHVFLLLVGFKFILGGFYVLEKLALSLMCCSVHIIRDFAWEKVQNLKPAGSSLCPCSAVC